MNSSRKSRLVKCAGFLSMPALPMLFVVILGASSEAESWDSIPDPYFSEWLIGCHTVSTPDGAHAALGPNIEIEHVQNCVQPRYAVAVDPQCEEKPMFYVVDGVMYGRDWQQLFDFKNLMGDVTPNARSTPLVQVRPDHPDMVVLFFGYAPPANTAESPRAYFAAIRRDALQQVTGLTKENLIALWPLVLDEEEERGCGSIHLAGAAENPAYPNTATAFVATCKHAYGFRLHFEVDGSFSSVERFFKETPSEIKAASSTEHRAEMVVAPAGNDYLVVWPYEEQETRQVVLSGSVIKSDGKVISHHEKRLCFSETWCNQQLASTAVNGRFITGLEVGWNLETVYVTTPWKPDSLYAFHWLDVDQRLWKTDSLPRAIEIPSVGLSQIEAGPYGVLRVLLRDTIGVVWDDYREMGYWGQLLPAPLDVATISGPEQEPPVLVLPAVTRGETYDCRK